MPVIHVCSLARLHTTVEMTGALHVVTLLKHTDRVERPRSVVPANHLILGMDDITVPMDGYTIPCDEHVNALITFVRGWDRAKPLVLHCYAGISRSTAGAYVAACALNPRRDEWAIAQALGDHGFVTLGRQGAGDNERRGGRAADPGIAMDHHGSGTVPATHESEEPLDMIGARQDHALGRFCDIRDGDVEMAVGRDADRTLDRRVGADQGHDMRGTGLLDDIVQARQRADMQA